MTIWKRIRISRFTSIIQTYICNLVGYYIFVRTESKDNVLAVYIIEQELDLILVIYYTDDQIKQSLRSHVHRKNILESIRREISLGYPNIYLFDNEGLN